MAEHQPGVYGYCEICGASLQEIQRGERSPECNTGVVGISHRIAEKKSQALMESVLAVLDGAQ